MAEHTKTNIINDYGYIVVAIHERIHSNPDLDHIPISIIDEWEQECRRYLGREEYLRSREHLIPNIYALYQRKNGGSDGER